MSKYVRDLLQEFETQTEIEDHFHLHVLKVTVSEKDEVEPIGNALPVTKIEIDAKDSECLLHFDELSSERVTIKEAKNLFSAEAAVNRGAVNDVSNYEVCACEEKERGDAFVRLDTPLIGFGENQEINCFFVVCQA